MEEWLEGLLRGLPEGTAEVSVAQLIVALSKLPNRSMRLRIRQEGMDWFLEINLSRLKDT